MLESQKNVVLFSTHLLRDYPEIWTAVSAILMKHLVAHGTLSFTKDYWVRDFMPIQIAPGVFRFFQYNPDYLQDKKRYISNGKKVFDKSPAITYNSFYELDIDETSLVLDGGNVTFVPSGDQMYIVMTDKVMLENPAFTKEEIEEELCRLLTPKDCPRVKIVWLPWRHSDMCGHTDGILRFIHNRDGRANVLVNLALYERSHAQEMREILNEHFNVIDLNLSRYDDLSWAYINFLQICPHWSASKCSLIIVPGIGDAVTDAEALAQLRKLYPNCDVEQVQMRDFIAQYGGALNCMTWTFYR